MEIRKLSVHDKKIENFIKEHSNCIFNSSDWLDILKEGFNTEVFYYALIDNESIVLALSSILLDFKFIKIMYSNIPYGGFIGEQKYIQYFLSLLEKRIKAEKIDILRITKKFDDNFDDLPGYKKQPAYQQIINIEGVTEQKLWQGYKKRVRRDIRKAEKSNIIIKEISDKKEIEILYDLYNETMKRNRSYTVWSKKAFYSIYENLVLKDKGSILFAKIDNKYIAGIILIYSSDTLYYFMNASLSKYLNLCPNDLLLHNAIVIAIKKNKKYVDLMTSRYQDKELIRFKEKWGSVCYSFDILEKYITSFRPKLWNFIWKVANSRIGSILIKISKIFLKNK